MQRFFFSIKHHYTIILQVAFGLLFVGFGIYFIRNQQTELGKVQEALTNANPGWILFGLLLLVLYVFVQGQMYKLSFAAFNQRISLVTAISLYLKRNLVGVFLPAGMFTNLFFFNEEVEKREGISRTHIYFASTMFSICSVISGIAVGLPALIWLLVKKGLSGEMAIDAMLIALALILVIAAIFSLVKKRSVLLFLEKKMPNVIQILKELGKQSLSRKKFWQVIGLSGIIECIGIAHLSIAIIALGGVPTFEIAIIGYSLVLVLLMTSPFLRGIGAIELALTYALTIFGFSTPLALSIAFLFRFFEFWSVLLLGILAMVAQRDNMLVRILPAFLLFLLGLVDIISALTPVLPQRIKVLTEVIPLSAIHASNWMVLLSGILLLGVSIYLIRGLRNAWIAAVILSGLSLVVHLTKGIDWEEATVALVTFGSLIYQRQQYFVRSDLKLAKQSIFPAAVAVGAVISFSTVGFYFVNPHHFNVDFTLWESLQEAVTAFFLLSYDLTPATTFAREFLLGMHILGGLTLTFVAYVLLRPLVQRPDVTAEENLQRAKVLVQKYGKGCLDYFKTYYDKRLWFSADGEGFVAFKTSQNYAMVLENPVCSGDAALSKIIPDFDAYCRQQGLGTSYYRIPRTSVTIYEEVGKNILPIGEEAVVNLEVFSLEGKEKAGLRNSINRLTKQGYAFQVNEPPQKDAFLQQLQTVSDSWLKDMNRSEIVFSQGLFDEKELKQHTILSLNNPEGKVAGFLNLIPDYAAGEANFDLMRKTEDAPNGTMDFLYVKMFEYLKSTGFKSCNLGMVPMSGINEPKNLTERVIKLAYERINQFQHYRSLRDYKEKFDPEWQMRYLTYDAPFDLIYLPGALEKVIVAYEE